MIFSEFRCKCKERISITKKRKLSTRSEGRRFLYPKSNELKMKTFQIKYNKQFSSKAKCIISSFQNKYLYHAIEDILDLLKSTPIERDNLLAIIYSPIISLQNNFCIDFFDIWIYQISINQISKKNRFLAKKHQMLDSFSYITITFFYSIKQPSQKREPLW